MDSFLNGLKENKNGNIIAKVLMKYNESEQNIRLNHKIRPGSAQNISKIYCKYIKTIFNRKLG